MKVTEHSENSILLMYIKLHGIKLFFKYLYNLNIEIHNIMNWINICSFERGILNFNNEKKPIGISKFFILKPRWCVSVSSNGMQCMRLHNSSKYENYKAEISSFYKQRTIRIFKERERTIR